MKSFRQSVNCVFILSVCGIAVGVQNHIPKLCPYASALQHGNEASSYVASSAILDVSFPEQLNKIAKNLDEKNVPHDLLSIYYTEEKPEKLQCLVPPKYCTNDTNNFYYRNFDGTCNNLQYPDYGMAKTRYSRMIAPKYGDGVYSPTSSVTGAPLPNARLISLSLFGEDAYSDSFRTMTSMQWGQLVAHDLSELTKIGAPSDCCADVSNKLCYPIYLHTYGPIAQGAGKTCIKFARATSDADAICSASALPYTEKISIVNAYLDLSSIYGNSAEQNKKIRVFKNGLLKTSYINNRHWLPISMNTNGECGESRNKCYKIPDMRNQFIPTIAVLHTVLQREHNRIAKILSQLNPQFSDEQIFQEARKINIGQYQKITYYEWLPLILGSSYTYDNQLIYYNTQYDYINDYDPRVNAAPYAEYAAAAFRYAHNLIPGWFSLVDTNRYKNTTLRLSDYFDRAETIELLAYKNNFDSLLRGLASQLHKRSDSNIDKELKHFFEREASEIYGSDLKAIDIQRGRDFGLPSYNEFRQYCGLKRANTWTDFLDQIPADKIALIRRIYTFPDDVDLAVGGSLEKHLPESIFGPTFQCIVTKQFLKTRIADRFFFENEDPYGGFKKEQLAEIRKVTLAGLFCNNADYLQYIQENVFVFPNAKNRLRHCSTIPQIDLTKWKY